MLSFPSFPSIPKFINRGAIEKQKNNSLCRRVIHSQESFFSLSFASKFFSSSWEKLRETTLTVMFSHQREDLINESILKELLVLVEHQEHLVLEERKGHEEQEMSFESYYEYGIDVHPTLLSPMPQSLGEAESSNK
jgi:hypothetical protein